MKEFLLGIFGISLGAIGCVVQLVLWGIGIIVAIWLGAMVLGWIF